MSLRRSGAARPEVAQELKRGAEVDRKEEGGGRGERGGEREGERGGYGKLGRGEGDENGGVTGRGRDEAEETEKGDEDESEKTGEEESEKGEEEEGEKWEEEEGDKGEGIMRMIRELEEAELLGSDDESDLEDDFVLKANADDDGHTVGVPLGVKSDGARSAMREIGGHDGVVEEVEAAPMEEHGVPVVADEHTVRDRRPLDEHFELVSPVVFGAAPAC